MTNDPIKAVGGIEHYSREAEGEVTHSEVWCSLCQNWVDEDKAAVIDGFIECIDCLKKKYPPEKHL
jgi:hypothetical protein